MISLPLTNATPIKALAGAAALIALAACADSEPAATDTPVAAPANDAEGAAAAATPEKTDYTRQLDAALDAQDEGAKARYAARHPRETLTFLGLEPGMTVVETLPGGGWYSKILLSYLGEDGTLIGAHYPDSLWPRINPDPEWVAGRVALAEDWANIAAGWGIPSAGTLKSVKMTEIPSDMDGTADYVLFIRSLHNLTRYEKDAQYSSDSLAETFRILKPGGQVGVVQHRAPAGNADAWADGSAGYLKQDSVIAMFEDAGFVLEASSEINANPNDVPTEEEFVWRLPPFFFGAAEGSPEREAFAAIGESDRMTLKFRKPE